MSTARDYLAAVQQRAKSSGTLSELGERLVELEETTDRLVAALTAALDGEAAFIPTPPGPQRAVRDTDLRNAGIAEGWRQAIAAITAALTPKEDDS